MAKPEWGTKRQCPNCGIRFYDLKKTTVICPECESPVPTEVLMKTRKATPKVAEVVTPKPADDDEIIVADLEIEVEDDDDEDDGLIVVDDDDDLDDDVDVIDVKDHSVNSDDDI